MTQLAVPTALPPSPLAPLRHPTFRVIWMAALASNLGTAMYDTAAAWTMTTLTTSPVMVTLLQTMASLPIFLFALPAGAMADLIDRRRLVLAAQTGAMIVAATLAVLAFRGWLHPWLLLGGSFLLGMGLAFTAPAYQSLLPDLVGRPLLGRAVALNGFSIYVARGIGPAIGGLLVAAAGPAAVFALNAVSFAGVIAAYACSRGAMPPRAGDGERMGGAMIAALRFARYSPSVHSVLLRNATLVIFGVAPVALLPLIAREKGFDAFQFGLLSGSYGLGAIFAALVVIPRAQDCFSVDRILLVTKLVSVVALAGLVLIEEMPGLAVTLAVAGGSWITSISTLNVTAQRTFPAWVRARSIAIYMIVMQGALGGGALLWGAVTGRSDTDTALTLAAAGLLLATGMIRLFPLRTPDDDDLAPLLPWPEHSLAVQPDADDGPVLVTVDYRVDPEQAGEFRRAMRALRRIRLRDGAFRWSLYNDLDDPWHFREGYLVGSWAEHLRQHKRALLADRVIKETVRSFHHGPDGPKVSHFLYEDTAR